MSPPASSVDLSVPYTTSGLSASEDNSPSGNSLPAPACDAVTAAVDIEPTSPQCTDGSNGTWTPFADTPCPSGTGSGTANFRFSCADGSDLVSGLGFSTDLLATVFSGNSKAATATANIEMTDVTATIDS